VAVVSANGAALKPALLLVAAACVVIAAICDRCGADQAQANACGDRPVSVMVATYRTVAPIWASYPTRMANARTINSRTINPAPVSEAPWRKVTLAMGDAGRYSHVGTGDPAAVIAGAAALRIPVPMLGFGRRGGQKRN
jgi:hypothetical protein